MTDQEHLVFPGPSCPLPRRYLCTYNRFGVSQLEVGLIHVIFSVVRNLVEITDCSREHSSPQFSLCCQTGNELDISNTKVDNIVIFSDEWFMNKLMAAF